MFTWHDPTDDARQTFPTGNGVEGGSFRFLFAVDSSAGGTLRAIKVNGDYNDDEIVNTADYGVWRLTFGSTSGPRADASGNNQVGAEDYPFLAGQKRLRKCVVQWSARAGDSGGPIVEFGAPPQVANVTVSGSQSTHDPYSFDDTDGSGEQLRTVPVGGARSPSRSAKT
jgi:hypothetical protein